MKSYCLFFVFLWSILPLTAQTESALEYKMGLIMDDTDYEKQPREPRFEGSKYLELPIKVDLTPYCPEVGHQGEIQSCVGWALGYGALTIQRAIQDNITDKQAITANANSALFIYNQVKQSDYCGSGAKISDAVELLMNNGDCLANNFDGDVNDCSKVPNPSLQAEAKHFAVTDFMTLFAKDEAPEIKILKVQKALANQQPVVVGLKVLKNFFHLKDIGYWRPEIGSQLPAGGHAMVVVGYDELRGAFRIMNSWGKEWGKDGFIWIKYKEFGKYCKYAYTIHLGENRANAEAVTISPDVEADIKNLAEDAPANIPTEPTAAVNLNAEEGQARIAGSFKFLYVDNEAYDDEPLIKPAAVTFNGQYYRVNRTDWEIGQLFQLLTISASKNEYIYVFSVDMSGEVNIHWPRSEELNSNFKGMNESALVTSVGAEIYIPGKDSGLKLEKKGTEQLCILFSKERITNIKAVSEYMEDQKDQFYESLIDLLQNFIIPTNDIQFSPNSIDFTTNSTRGFIVPIVVELEAK